jgi:hypothetical protein
MECSAAKDPDLPCDAGSVTRPIDDDDRVLVREEYDREAGTRRLVLPDGYTVKKELLDHDAIAEEQKAFARRQLGLVADPHEPEVEEEAEEEAPPAEANPDQVLQEVLAWLRPLTELEQKRVVVAAQVMLGIL